MLSVMATSTRLLLDVDLRADPIAGTLTTADGTVRPFSGWIGLSAAIGAIAAQAREGEPA